MTMVTATVYHYCCRDHLPLKLMHKIEEDCQNLQIPTIFEEKEFVFGKTKRQHIY